MRKSSSLGIIGLTLAVLAGAFLMKSVNPTTGALSPQPTLSIGELYRAMDMKALPAQEIEDPV
jgi:hypothetical protein